MKFMQYLPLSLIVFDLFDRDLVFFGAATAFLVDSPSTDFCERVTKFEDKKFTLDRMNKKIRKNIEMQLKIALMGYIWTRKTI